MTNFFDSNLIKDELDQIHELQLECFENAFMFEKMPHESQKEHIDNWWHRFYWISPCKVCN